MEKIGERICNNYMNVLGGGFPNWYEGLSPIESYLFNKQLRLK